MNILEKSTARIKNPSYFIYNINSKSENLDLIDKKTIFAIIDDIDGFKTVVTHKKINNIEEHSTNWKLICITIDAPPTSIGIAAQILFKLASLNISVVPIASYSRANILIQEKDISNAKMCLEELGISF